MELDLRTYTSPCESSLAIQWRITPFGVHGGLLPMESPVAGYLWEQAEELHSRWLQHPASVLQKHKTGVWGHVLPFLWSQRAVVLLPWLGRGQMHVPSIMSQGGFETAQRDSGIAGENVMFCSTIMFLACSLGPSSCNRY